MSDLDNSMKQNRTKQIVFWNLQTLNNIVSLSQAIMHHPYPQLYTQRDTDWRDLFLLQKIFIKGQQLKDTFISKSKQYISTQSTFDRVGLYKSQLLDLSMTKHQFWTRLYKLSPNTKEDYECRRIVRNIVWRERVVPICFVLVVGSIINILSGFGKFSVQRKAGTYAAMLVVAEIMVRIKKSDKIFYQIPVLPNPQLEAEREEIRQQSLVLDGKINSYGLLQKMENSLLAEAEKEKKTQQKQWMLKALGYKIITKADLAKN